MTKLSNLCITAALTYLVCSTSVLAEDEKSNPSIRPIEIFACDYNNGKDAADLVRATARWNTWMNKNNQSEYWAFTLAPMFHSEQIDFDVAWVGGWKDGATMAASTEFWLTKGALMQAEFAKVVTCNIHTNFAVLDISPSPDPWASGPVEFSNCTVEKGRSHEDAIGAIHKWIAYQSEHGIESGNYVLYPAYGESSEAEYDFKWVVGYSYKAFGKNYDMYGTGAGWRKAEELFGGLLDCDNARVYHATAVRTVELD
ncbi:MAG: hypothetical protein OER80_09225 [Gammaproteobacteria bacterium]|nr:hypothetical protein [Gammaproteobacteria bacterium]MDH3767225.1 hypothetical protein [Gammaproteobacteria bacterium]